MNTFPNAEIASAWASFKQTGSVSSALQMVMCFNDLRNQNMHNEEQELGM